MADNPTDNSTAQPPIVLVHGLATSSARTWGETGWLDLLADAGKVVIPIDLPGHGEASRPHSPAEVGDVEAGVLAQFPDEPVDAIGFSLGAHILLTIASEAPDRFNRLVVAGVGRNLFELVKTGDIVDVDADNGVVKVVSASGETSN